jgi:hypothetical protein
MHNLCRLFFLSVLLSMAGTSMAQVFYQPDTTVKVIAYGQEQNIAWGGGFNNPQFSLADLNHDGKKDLVVFEQGIGVSTYINYAPAGSEPNYRYAPEYALNFPPIYNYLVMADYNCDGIADLFHRGGSGFAVYHGYYNGSNQLCFTYYKDLYYDNDVATSGLANAFVNPGDIPAIVDVDGDGDLDFVSYYITGGYLYYYKNMQVEMGLPCDSIHIALKDRCWGKVYQGFYRAHTIPYSCDNSGLMRPAGTSDEGKRTHSGNTPCLFDWDMDGDMDYLDGSVSYNEMTFLKNGRIEHGGGPDSMITQDSMWQTGGKQVEIPTWPTAYNLDIDQDGKKDLLITPNAGSGSENYKCIWYYKNLTTPGAPSWQFQSDSFLVDKSIDLGSASYPMLFDYDRDGKPDLIVGSDGYRQPGGLLQSRLSYYKNTSTPGNASFTLQSSDFGTVSGQNFKGAAPAAGDIDGDGKDDLVLGHSDGTLSYYKNMAASDAVQPNWQLTELQLTDLSGTVINSGGYATPFIYDMDHDGKKDLIIGSLYGYIRYYRNVSITPGTIRLQLVNSRLGGANADPRQNFGNYSSPFIGKVDATGTDFLLLGSNSGNIYRYTGFQGGDTTATYALLDTQYSYIDTTYNLYNSGGTYYGIYGSRRSTVAVGDIDGSGSYSMIVGNVRGGLEFYKRKVYIVATPTVSSPLKVNVYPNPAKDVLNVSWDGLDPASEVTISFVNLTGQQLSSAKLPSSAGHTVLSLAALPQGVYICLLQSGMQRYYSKFTVIR